MFATRSVALAVGLTMFALVVTGCGGGGGDDAADDTFLIATSGTFKPITFSEGGKLTGFDIELGTKVAEKLGMKPEFVSGQLSGLLPGLNAGKFDAVMSGLTMTEERMESITFSEPYLVDGAVAVVKADDTKVKDVSLLKGLTVGAIGGSGTEADIKRLGGYEELKAYPGGPEGFADVAAGRIDVFATGQIAAKEYIATAPDGAELKIVGELYSPRPSAIGLPKKDDGMKAKIDPIIKGFWTDGTIESLQKKWFGYTIELQK